MRRGVDWSAVAARDAIDGCTSGELPGPFAALARTARGQTSVVGDEDDSWASVREDVPHSGAACSGGRCGCASCKGGESVAGFWAPAAGATRRPTNARPSKGQTQGRGTSERGRIASQSGPQTQEEREASAEAEQTNAVIATGDPKIIEAWLAARDSGDLEATRSFWERYGDEVWPKACPSWTDTLEPPGYWDTSKEPNDLQCYASVLGTTSDCVACIREQDEDDLASTLEALRDDAEDVLRWKNISDDLKQLLTEAWALLLANTDLIEWASCWGTGGRDASDCVKDRLRGKGVNVRLRGISDSTSSEAEPASHKRGRTIKIYTSAVPWTYMLEDWASSDSGAHGCAVVSAAIALFHELLHVCHVSYSDDHNTRGYETCDEVYVTTSVFGYGLAKRYPFIVSNSECGLALGSFAAPYNLPLEQYYE